MTILILVLGGSPCSAPKGASKADAAPKCKACMYTYVSDIAYSQHIAWIRSITHIHTHRCPCAIGPCVCLHRAQHWHCQQTTQICCDPMLVHAVLTEGKVMLGTCPMCDHTLLHPSHTHPLSLSPTTSPLSLSHRHNTPPSPTDTTPAPPHRPRMTSKITP